MKNEKLLQRWGPMKSLKILVGDEGRVQLQRMNEWKKCVGGFEKRN